MYSIIIKDEGGKSKAHGSDGSGALCARRLVSTSGFAATLVALTAEYTQALCTEQQADYDQPGVPGTTTAADVAIG